MRSEKEIREKLREMYRMKVKNNTILIKLFIEKTLRWVLGEEETI